MCAAVQLYDVTSLAFDPDGRRLFFTTNNTHGLRNLNVFDLKTHKRSSSGTTCGSAILSSAARTGRFGEYGMQTGCRALCAWRPPFKSPRVLYTLPYASDFFNLDLSPDGTQLTGALTDESGTQRLVRYQTADLLAGKTTHEVLYDFQFDSPDSFTFSPDGRVSVRIILCDGRFESVSFRSEDKKKLDALSNSETGTLPATAARMTDRWRRLSIRPRDFAL